MLWRTKKKFDFSSLIFDSRNTLAASLKSCLCILPVSPVPSQIPPKLNLFGNNCMYCVYEDFLFFCFGKSKSIRAALNWGTWPPRLRLNEACNEGREYSRHTTSYITKSCKFVMFISSVALFLYLLMFSLWQRRMTDMGRILASHSNKVNSHRPHDWTYNMKRQFPSPQFQNPHPRGGYVNQIHTLSPWAGTPKLTFRYHSGGAMLSYIFKNYNYSSFIL